MSDGNAFYNWIPFLPADGVPPGEDAYQFSTGAVHQAGSHSAVPPYRQRGGRPRAHFCLQGHCWRIHRNGQRYVSLHQIWFSFPQVNLIHVSGLLKSLVYYEAALTNTIQFPLS